MTSSDGEVITQVGDSNSESEEFRNSVQKQKTSDVPTRRSPPRINPKRKPDKSKIFRIRTSDAEEALVCPTCHCEFLSKEEMDDHKADCTNDSTSNAALEVNDDDGSPDDLRIHQDMENNNQARTKTRSETIPSPNSRESSVERTNGYDSDSNLPENGALAQIRHLLQQTASQIPLAQQLAQSNLALEAIQNTRMALAQLATTALGNGQPATPQAMHEMAVLQGTLYTLQQQQMMQLQLIQQLQAQLSIKNKECTPPIAKSPERSSPEPADAEMRESSASPSLSVPLPPSDDTPPTAVTSSFFTSLMERFKTPKSEASRERGSSSAGDHRDRPISPPMSASSIASSIIQHTDPPPPDEPNTLEMLQRTANQVLNNASQGLLTNRLIDDYNKQNDGKDAYYKHRCRYCGKVFGSDSALQIHVRSHTGERPFKCNICGNRFTTKGNLKVHFQRHATRFPHVKMNPHPVPEHLDKFHPPLLAQLGELKDYPSPPTGPPNPFANNDAPPLPPYRLPGPRPPPLNIHKQFPSPDFLRRITEKETKEEPENLTNRAKHFDYKDNEKITVNQSDSNRDSPESSSPFKAVIKDEEQRTTPPIEDENRDDSRYSESFRDTADSQSNLRESLREAMRNSLGEPVSDSLRESLQNSLSDHMRREHFREKIRDEPRNDLLKDSLSDRLPFSVREAIRENLRESLREQIQDSLKNHGEDERDTNSKLENSERDMESDTPVDIRVRKEQDLKDSESEKTFKEDPDSNDSHTLSSEQPADLRLRPEFRPLGLPNMHFPGPRLPLAFPFIPGLSQPFPVGAPPPASVSIPPNIDPAKDPNIYTNLLPRPGSTDNSWEALIEVQKTSETMKLEQLVNNIEHKLTDPNQCVICHRVLSCKSALQMHYRTHTGERPFKCKICGRAFTTKGNLKTHMGVHRAKPPMRMLHQCPVCHKKYTNALVLQQHIRLHTGEPTDLTMEQIAAAEVRDYPHLGIPTSLPQLLPTGFPLPPQHLHSFPPLPLHMRYQLSPDMLRKLDTEGEDRREEDEKYMRQFSGSSRSSSTGSAEQRTAEDLSVRLREENLNGVSSPQRSISPTPSDYSEVGDRVQEENIDSQHSPSDREVVSGRSSNPVVSLGSQESTHSLPIYPLDLAAKPPPPLFSPFGLFPPPLTSASLSPVTPTSLPSISPLYLPNLPGRGNTTCQVCFKTFACQSALEIHYRSHTKERPFKCTVCDRGFSTKSPLFRGRRSGSAFCVAGGFEPILSGLISQGNMKQHMLTHKIRDGVTEEGGKSSSGGFSSEVSYAGGGSTSPAVDVVGPREEDKNDSGLKREREGELHLPVPKRTSGASVDAESGEKSLEELSPARDDPPVLSPAPSPSETRKSRSPPLPHSPPTSAHLKLHNPLFSSPLTLPSPLPIPTSIALPSSLSLPSSLALSSPQALHQS